MILSRVFLGLGSNLGDKKNNLTETLSLLQTEDIKIIKKSSLYQSQPWGNHEQPLFYNAVILAETTLSPQALLRLCQKIEKQLGRQRLIHWGPRTIDIDILLFDDISIKTNALTIPHIYLKERDFVLWPLYELAPVITIPGQGKLTDLIKKCSPNGLKIIEKIW